MWPMPLHYLCDVMQMKKFAGWRVQLNVSYIKTFWGTNMKYVG